MERALAEEVIAADIGGVAPRRKRGTVGSDEMTKASVDAAQPARKRRHSKAEESLVPISGSMGLSMPMQLEAGVPVLPETDLSFYRPSPGAFEALSEGEFAIVDRLAGGINGDVFSYQRTRAGRAPEDVVVKKLRRASLEHLPGAETNERTVHFQLGARRPSQEDALTEIGVLRLLAKQPDLPRCLLRYQGAYVSSSDGSVWLVTELAEGGDLLAEVQRQGTLSASCAQTLSWQILQGVAYLHKHQIGHRDISLENVLLKGGEVRIMDFGAAVRSSTTDGTALRYFGAAGKDFYRAPECYVPMSPVVEVLVPEDARPGGLATVLLHETNYCEVRLPATARPGALCSANVWGYEVPPADMWSVGVCVFIMLVGCPAWGRATRADPLFNFTCQHGLAALPREWRKPALPCAAQALVDCMTALTAADRPTAAECLEADWFEGLRGLPVALHEYGQWAH